jgi:hypothetical protein
MYQDLWVASDGITVVRLSDEASARIYCAESDWNFSDIVIIRTPVTLNPHTLAVTVSEWLPAMDPEIGTGEWQESEHYTFWLPDLSESAIKASEGSPYTPVSEEVVTLSRKLGWPYRDLAASTESMIAAVSEYVTNSEAAGKEISAEAAMEYAFTQTGLKRILN